MNKKIDLCAICVNKSNQETIDICPKCGNKTLHFQNYGASCLCANCGYGYATTPEFPPCHLDQNHYIVSVSMANIEVYVQLARIMSCGVVTLKKSFDAGLPIEKEGRLLEIQKTVRNLNKIGVKFSIKPDVCEKYSELEICMFNSID